MRKLHLVAGTVFLCVGLATPYLRADDKPKNPLLPISNIVVIYAENRSFDNLYGFYQGANGLQNLKPEDYVQYDREGKALTELPKVIGGVPDDKSVKYVDPEHLPDAPYSIEKTYELPLSVRTQSPTHKFYQNQMQIGDGGNHNFVAYSEQGRLVMGYYDGSVLPMWSIAQKYVLADNFFMGAFGGSFLNHFWLICACTPFYPDAGIGPAKGRISILEDGSTTALKKSTMEDKAIKKEKWSADLSKLPYWEGDGDLTPDFYAVNTMQPPYQPSQNKAAAGDNPAFADLNPPANAPPSYSYTLPPQTMKNIGDLLSANGVTWAWYAGAWQVALDGQNQYPVPFFQYHHHPFNYFVTTGPGTGARSAHLRDGGLRGAKFIEAIETGSLPQVAFYKPQGNLNEHAGYADVMSGDQHIADVVRHLEKSPQWPHMIVVVTYDENGGFWDHVSPPKGDRWGPGSRIPAIIISPFERKAPVDHTLYDTTSILRLIKDRFELEELPGMKARREALAAHGNPPIGNLTQDLNIQ